MNLLKKLIKYNFILIVVVAGIALIFFGNSYNRYHASRMKIRSYVALGEYVLAEQKLAEVKKTGVYRSVFKRFKLKEYYQVFYDDGLIQLGMEEYVEAEKRFSTASESGDVDLASSAGLNRVASLWFSGQRNPKIIKTILDVAGKIIKDNHDISTSYEKRKAQQIAYYIMARQQDAIPREEGKGKMLPGKGRKDKKAQIEAFKNLMKKKEYEEGR